MWNSLPPLPRKYPHCTPTHIHFITRCLTPPTPDLTPKLILSLPLALPTRIHVLIHALCVYHLHITHIWHLHYLIFVFFVSFFLFFFLSFFLFFLQPRLWSAAENQRLCGLSWRYSHHPSRWQIHSDHKYHKANREGGEEGGETGEERKNEVESIFEIS